MTDTHSPSTVDAGDTVASDAADQTRLEVPGMDEPSTELTGTAAAAAEPGETATATRPRRGRGRRGKRKEHLAEAVIEEVDSARVADGPLVASVETDEPAAPVAESSTDADADADMRERMLVAPPAHSATRDASVPTWTFETD